MDWLVAMQWGYLGYFVLINFCYLFLNVASLFIITRHMRFVENDGLPDQFSDFEQPVSIIVPAFDEAAMIVTSVRSLLQLHYSEFEVIVVNDGSTDETMAALRSEFGLVEFPEAYRIRLKTKRIRAHYRSPAYRNLRVVDKENGGKADALNAGINCARFPLFCSIDADSILQPESLRQVARPFLEHDDMVACGGTIRIANGCKVRDGFLEHMGLPRNPLALFQVIEYLRAFLFGRTGWASLNAVMVISGAFGLFHKESVVTAGGYSTKTVGEDMELITRLHKTLRAQGKKYRITFVPDPICWTEVPEDLGTLRRQRVRWQRGLGESLVGNLSLLFRPGSGAVGWLAFPFMLFFEWLSPLVEVVGAFIFIIAFAVGAISMDALLAFGFVAIGLGVVLSTSALLLEELSFKIYNRPRDVLLLFFVAVLENFGYRQLVALWRLVGLMQWIFVREASWGTMVRNASWRKAD